MAKKAKKTTKSTKKKAAATSDPFEAFPIATIKTQQTARAPHVTRLSRAVLTEIVRKLTPRDVTLAENAVMTLTARHPFETAGFMDFFQPGRWDCAIDLVFMAAIIQTGPSPGMWDGTVGYVRFTAPTAGTYLIVVNFSGYQITMNLHGPWGNNTAYCPTTSDTAAASALWTGTAGQTVNFTINCTGGIMGYLESVQVIPVT